MPIRRTGSIKCPSGEGEVRCSGEIVAQARHAQLNRRPVIRTDDRQAAAGLPCARSEREVGPGGRLPPAERWRAGHSRPAKRTSAARLGEPRAHHRYAPCRAQRRQRVRPLGRREPASGDALRIEPEYLMRAADLIEAPHPLRERWASDVQDLTAVQQAAVRAGALGTSDNLLIVAPTSSGKTFVGEVVATTEAFRRRGPAVMIVPHKAVAQEHFETFRERYQGLLSVVISTADWTEFDDDVRRGNFDLAVLTYEKLMSLVMTHPDLLGRLSAIVVDEIQMLRDPHRGPALEILLTRVLMRSPGPRLVGLSASLEELNDLHGWLRASLVSESERPIPLEEGVVDASGVRHRLAEGNVQREQLLARPADPDALINLLCARLVEDDRQVVVFHPTIRETVAGAEALVTLLPAVGLERDLALKLEELEDSEAKTRLRRLLPSRVAYHNADLTHAERQLIEEAFRSGHVAVLFSTTTLAMGINLPCDDVIVASVERPTATRAASGAARATASPNTRTSRAAPVAWDTAPAADRT